MGFPFRRSFSRTSIYLSTSSAIGSIIPFSFPEEKIGLRLFLKLRHFSPQMTSRVDASSGICDAITVF